MSASPIVKSSVGICAVKLCQKPGHKQCQACRGISYCSAEHQKEDWKRHRRHCSQFVLRVNSELNRHFVATRKFRPGSIMIDESPLLYGPRVPAAAFLSSTLPKPEIDQSYCLSCCKSIQKGGSICPKCTWPLFCSLNCAKVKAHTGNECKYFTTKKIKYSQSIIPNHVLYRGIMILRAVLQKSKSSDGIWSSLTDLQHERSDNLSTGGYQIEPQLVTKLQSYFKMKDLNYDPSDWVLVNGAINVNAFSIEREEGEGEPPSKVTALFHKSSFFAHSCLPNCIWELGYSPDFPMRIRASRTIEKDEILTIAYNPGWGTYGMLRRREMILETGGFLCKCSRCEDPTEAGTYMSSVKCGISSCTGYLSPVLPSMGQDVRWKCNFGSSSCPAAASSGVIDLPVKTETIEQEFNEILSSMAILPINTIAKCIMEFISTYSGTLLHPNHWILQQASQALVHAFGSQIKNLTQSQLTCFVHQCHYLLRLTKMLNSGICVQRAVLELYLSRALYIQYQKNSIWDDGGTPEEKLEFLQEIHAIQLDSFLYWKDDIQSKHPDEVMGYEASQLNYEIIAVLSEYETVKKLKE